MNTRDIYKALRRSQNLLYQLENSYIYPWESDFFGITNSGYAVEIEIKVSRADYLKDFQKKQKHNYLANGHKPLIVARGAKHYGKSIRENGRYIPAPVLYQDVKFIEPFVPNRFYYACPDKLIGKHEVPKYAGLMQITSDQVKVLKKAPLIHRRKIDLSKILLDKFYYKSLSLRQKIFMLEMHLHKIETMYEIPPDEMHLPETILFQ